MQLLAAVATVTNKIRRQKSVFWMSCAGCSDGGPGPCHQAATGNCVTYPHLNQQLTLNCLPVMKTYCWSLGFFPWCLAAFHPNWEHGHLLYLFLCRSPLFIYLFVLASPLLTRETLQPIFLCFQNYLTIIVKVHELDFPFIQKPVVDWKIQCTQFIKCRFIFAKAAVFCLWLVLYHEEENISFSL